MYNTIEFIAFFITLLLLLVIIDHFNANYKLKNIVLLLVCFFFYSLFNIYYLFILLFVIGYTYIFSILIKKDQSYLKFGIILSIIILALFKYFNFFMDSFYSLLHISNNPILNLIAPVGISFYVFKSISYLVDISRKKIEPEKDIVIVALYLSYFPEIVAGPISRSNDLMCQLRKNREISIDSLSTGFQIFLFGLFKKIVLADNISVFVNEVYRAPRIYSSLTIILCIIAYSIQIYLDFSGYSDMTIGCSKMLGIDIKKNFNAPYLSHNVTEFWKRWHISLSSWLQDYVYIPLGGNRKGKNRQYLNLLITMIICGLWHGNDITYIIWGLVNGLALVVHKNYIETKERKDHSVVSIIITFIFVSLTWVLFRADNLQNALDVYSSIFNSAGISFLHINTLVCVAIFVIVMVIIYKKYNSESTYFIQDLNTVKGLVIVIMLIGIIIGFAYTGFNPFIYSSF